MNNNQSIEDILRQLKSSVSTEDTSERDPVIENSTDDYSEEVLKRELKNQYFAGDDNASYVLENEYSIDKDFLNEAESFVEETPQVEEVIPEDTVTEYIEEKIPEEAVEETAEETVLEDLAEDVVASVDQLLEGPEVESEIVAVTADEISEDVAQETEDLPEVIDSFTEDVEDVHEMFEDEFDDDADDGDVIDDISDKTADAAEEGSEEVADENVQDIDAPFELIALDQKGEGFDEEFETEDYEQDIVYTAIQLETHDLLVEGERDDETPVVDDVDKSSEHEELNIENIETEVADADGSQQAEQNQSRSTYISLMRSSGVDFSTNDANRSRIYESAEEHEETSAKARQKAPKETVKEDAEALDLSTINLMMQLGEREEVAERIGDENIDGIIENSQEPAEPATESPIEHGGEYVAKEQDETIRASYKKKYLRALFSMCGCLFLAIMSAVFEALPIFEISLGGLFDYVQYPSFYILVGLQFVIFAAAISVKQLWSGVQRIIIATPDRYSLIVVIIGATVIYDAWTAIAVAVGGDVVPPLFNAVTAAAIAISSVIDFIKISANMHIFNVYSSDSNKFTLIDERQCGKIAEKMYAGGLESTKRVYTAAAVDFPRGLFRGISEKDGQSPMMTWVMIVSILISVIATVVSTILGFDIYASLGAFMTCMFASMPICLMCADNIPLASAAVRLAKRGIAIAGKGAVETHSKCDVMVFGDLHMFKKCRTEDVGIAIYDKGVAYLTLGCISALYSKIGGPISGMDMNLPDVFKFQNVDIKRVTRSGIEAVIDKKHVLVVGERSFLLRYGIVFPEDEIQNDRSNLCVSLNGGMTAKLSVKYEPEPIFEMLIERLNREGITCAIETYDPLINSDMIARSRTLGDAPVSVVHKNAEDYRVNNSDAYRGRLDGVIACSSRLKLAEAAVWLKKLRRVEKKTKIFSACSCGVGALGAMLVIIFGGAEGFNQYHALMYLLFQLVVFSEMLFSTIPLRKYFSVEALYDELEKESLKQQKRLEREDARREMRMHRAQSNSDMSEMSEGSEIDNIQEESDINE